MVDRTQALEEQIAHLQRLYDDLSDVIARQQGELRILHRRVELLMTREAEREQHEGTAPPLADQKPPHW